jgi:UDP-N-acetylmuramoylalanine--D-glutamate ligase
VRTAALRTEVCSRPVQFSRLKDPGHGAFVRSGRIIFRDENGERNLFAVDVIKLKGVHNLENVLAACSMAILAGAPFESLEESIRRFKGVEHRIEFVSELDGVQYFNDSKATNVAATVKALEAFPGNILLIAGGRDKEGDFVVLKSLVRERVKHLVLIGESAGKIRKALSDATDTSNAQSMEEAVAVCREIARPGDIVLLAPACASFDMFQDYEHRGRVFKEAVRRL